jgi:hypothetical protein
MTYICDFIWSVAHYCWHGVAYLSTVVVTDLVGSAR